MDSSIFDISNNLSNDDLKEYEKFRAFKCQLSRVQSLINEFFGKSLFIILLIYLIYSFLDVQY